LYREKSALAELYGFAEPGGRGNVRRPLYRLTTHSLRHYGIWTVYEKTKDPHLAQKFARHKHLDTTLKYLRKSRKEEVEVLIHELSSSLKRREVLRMTVVEDRLL
jgi:hypothetical protein